MNRKLQMLAIALGLSAPLLATAQSSSTQGLTREQVRQEMVEYKAAGFNPARMNPRTWVDDAQSALTKVTTARTAQTSNQFAVNKSEDASQCN
ncbi:DUF4148 domain-containing protein [Paraburkholderia metrosideri]|uniref:DUF4148 domain-containing protein n=1 Tax=Paraburkholderia metrosideri TaxID=580937 RepID=A0ABM8NBV3_9BURK|nr:DUF4148 domain-containing protein [Paraburkholderia metrosideri]CAD6516179.1 hypothetical protein LMG28140_00728 [Paraburkholderia metrosideri]